MQNVITGSACGDRGIRRARARGGTARSLGLLAGVSTAALFAGGAAAQTVVTAARPTTVVTPAADQAGTPIVVTTTDIRGTVALNRFSDFQVARPDSVTMVLPTSGGQQVTHLVNLVDSANGIRIDGTVVGRYGSADGAVGGHLLFAAPGGIVIGEGAKVYAGRVSLVSSSAGKLDSAFDAADPVAAMLGVSPSGGNAVTVGGTIYAPGGVTVRAPTVTIGRAGVISAGLEGSRGLVAAGYVQTTLPEADRIIVGGDGAIEFVADKVEVQGGATLTAKLLDYDTSGITAGGVRITAPDVSFAGGSTIDAWDATAGRGGAVTITARQDAKADQVVDALAKLPSATAQVVLAGAIDARSVAVTATATATTEGGLVSAAALAEDVLGLGSAYAGLKAAVSKVSATGTIAVVSGARIEAHGGALSLDASTDATAEADADRLSTFGQSQIELGMVYAQLDATANVTVNGTLKAAGAVTLSATNNAMTQANAVTYGRGANGLAVTIAREKVAATVDTGGAAIDAVGALTVKAYNQEAFEAKAASYQVKGADGQIAEAGGAAVVALRDVTATATLGGTVNVTGAAPTVSVTAGSDSTHDVIAAQTLSGDPPKTVEAKALVESAPIALGQALYDKFSQTKQTKPAGGTDPHDNLAAAFTLELATQGASASIAPGARLTALGATVDAAATTRDGIDLGDGDLNDGEVKNAASAEVSVKRKDSENKQASTALAFSIGIKDYVGHATIGEGAIIAAGSLAVTADTSRNLHVLSGSDLVTAPSLDIDGIQDYAAKLDNGVFTSQAVSAAGTGTGNAYVGSVGFNAIDADTRAWVDSRADLTLGADSTTRTALSIAATTTIETTQLIGKLKLGAGVNGGDRAGGAALGITLLTPVTIAGIGDGATVTADGTVAVQADAALTSLTLAALSAGGKGIGVSGTFGANVVDGSTHATISNSATIDAAAVDVDAVTALDLWSTAGALATSTGGGSQQTQGSVGASGAANLITFDTYAAIGGNDADDADEPSGGARVTAPGRVAADTVTVDAVSKGRVGTLAVAGAYSGNTSDTSKGAFGKLKDGSKALYDTVDAIPQALTNALATLTGQQAAKQGDLGGGGTPAAGAPASGFGISGSATATVTDLDTSATIAAARITGRGATPAGGLVRVSAAGDTDLYSVSGAGAIGRAKATSAQTQNSLAGAIGIQVTDNQVAARVADSDLTGHRDTIVLAVTRGDRLAVGLGLAVDLSSQKVSSRAAAASVTYSKTDDSADAAITGGSVTGRGTGQGALQVGALNSLEMNLGSGGITYGGKQGLGIAVTVADARGGASAAVTGKVADFDSATILAHNAAQVISVGAAVAVSTRAGASQFFGAGVVNLVDMDASATLDTGAGFAVGGALSVVAGGSDPVDWLGLADRPDGVSGKADDYSITRQELGLSDGQGSFDTAIGLGKAAFDPGTRILGIAGGVGITGSEGNASAGVNIAYNAIDNDSTAAITGAGDLRAGKLTVSADDAADILAASVGAAIGGQKAVLGSLTVNHITGTVSAGVGASNATIGAGGVAVTAAATGGIISLAGQFVRGNSAGGAAVAYNELARDGADGADVKASLAGTTLTSTGDVIVGATSSGTIRSAAAAGANAKAGAALTGAATANVIQSDVGASVSNATIAAGQRAVTVEAKSQGAIDSLALGVAFGQGSGDGYGIAVNRLDPTVSASVTRSSIAAASLSTAALADSAIRTLAAGIGKAELASAASIVVNLMGGAVSAGIADGSVIDTSGTTSVTAEDTGTADVLAGEVAYGTGAALGLTSTINKLTATTSATVNGSTVRVGAAGGGATVNSGVLATPIAQGNSLAAFANSSMDQTGVAVHGLAVNAASARRLRVAGGAVAAGNVAIGASLAINLVSGATLAQLDGTTVTASGGADVDVRASTITAGATVLASLAPGSGAGVAGAANAEVYSASTEAVVSGGTIAADALDVRAISTQTIGSLAAGGGAGSSAAALAGIGMSLSTFTSARVGGGATIDTNALTIDARNGVGLIGGALGVGVGSSAALGAGLLVVFNDGTVEALLGGDDHDASKPAAAVQHGSVAVTADGDTDLGVYAAAGGASLAAGAAATGIAVVQKNVVHAIAQDASIGTSGVRAGAVSLLANNALTMRSISGAAGVGIAPTGVGIGLGATVLSVQSDVVAQAIGSTVHADTVGILARDDSQVDTNAWTAAIGGVAVSANALYVQFGTDAESNGFYADRSIGGTGSDNRTLTAIGTRAPTGGALASGDLSADDRAALGQSAGAASAVKNNAGHRIVATIGGGSAIDAGSVTVDAAQGLRTITRAGNISAGPIALAGTVGLVRAYSNVAATIDAGSAVTVSGDVAVKSGTDERLPGVAAPAPGSLDAAYPGAPTRAAEGYSVLGTAAVTGGNVGYTDVRLKNNVAASVGGSVTGGGSGTLTIDARDGTDAAATTLGLSVGLATLSGSIARASRQSTTAATLSGTTRGFTTTGVNASDTGRAETLAVAGTGALFGGSAAYAQSLNHTIVSATIAGSGSIADGATTVSASATPLVAAKAVGVTAAAGVAVGASVAEAAQSGVISATVEPGASVQGALSVAGVLAAANGPLVSANAIAGAGAALAGAVGTRATATNSASVFASVGAAGSTAPVVLGAGALSITASRTGDTIADALGAAGGLVGLGANFATADGTGTTSAILGQADGASRDDDDLTITADAGATVQATATAGSGGVIAGAGADARTIDNSTTVARFAATPFDIGTTGLRSIFTAGRATIAATQLTTSKAAANTVTAAALGASGAIVRQTIGTTTLADVGAGATLSAGYIAVQANASATTGAPGDYVADAGSGGIANGAAIDVSNTITPTVRTQIGAGAVLAQANQPAIGNGAILIGAYNSYRSDETVRMNTYSAVASPLAKLATNAVLTTDTVLGDGVQVSGEDYVSIRASNATDVDHTAYNKVYGGASYGAADVATSLTGNGSVTLGAGAQIVSLDDVRIAADGFLGASSESQVYNWTFAPLSTDADASATTSGANTVTLGMGSILLAGGDVAISAAAPGVDTTAHWEEHSTYRAGLASIANALGANVSTYEDGDGDTTSGVSGGLNLLGGVSVIGGAFARRAITIDDGSDGTLNFTTEGFDAITLATPDGTGVLRLGGTATGADDLVLTQLADGSLGIGAFAANGGNVTIDAPGVTASGAPNAIAAKVADVDITSNSTTPISIGGITVPIDRGGTVKWSGGTLSTANLTLSQASDDQLSAIGITSTANGGDLAIRGEIDARTADLNISVQHANYYQTAPISVRGYTVDVPNGDINIDLTNQTYAPVNAMNFWRGQAGVSLTTMGGTIGQTSADEIAAIAAYAGFLGSNYLKSLGITTGTLADLQNRVNQFWVSPLLGSTRNASTIAGPVDRFGTPTRITVGAQTSWAWGGNYALNSDAGPVSNFTCCGYPGIQTAYTSGGRADSFSLVSVPMSVLKQGWDTTRAPFEGGSFDTASNSFLVTALASAAKPVTANAISAQNILISAQIIDLNGKVSVGSTPLQDVTITTALDTQFRNYAQSRGLANGTLVSIDKIDPARDRNQPGFSYVVGENRYVVNDVTMTAGPRAIFRGIVLNTNPLGSAEIVVNDGQGTINVVNQTGAGVTVNRIDAGAPRQGSVEFKFFDNFTKFTHDSTNNLVITKDDRIDRGVIGFGPDGYTRVNDTTGYYNPAEGSVYQWTDSANVARNFPNAGGVVLQYMDDVHDQRATPWFYFGQPTIAATGSYLGTDQHNAMVDGIGYDSAAFSQRVTATVTSYATWDNRRNDNPNATVISDAPISQIWAMPQQVKVTTVNTARADFPIKISFTGDPVGKVNLNSNGALTLDGAISNPTGTTKITAVSGLTFGATTTIDTGSLDISNFHGGIGSLGAPLIVKLADGGTLKANASDWYATPADIAITTQGGDTMLSSVHATGDIRITALEGSLLGAGLQSAGVVGNNITLSAPIGSVGTVANPVYVGYSYGRDFYYDPNVPFSTGGGVGDTDQPDAIGVLNVAARDGVAITSQGPMRVGLVYAPNAPIRLESIGGDIVSANSAELLDPAAVARLAAAYDSLKLRGADLDDAIGGVVTAFNAKFARDLSEYAYLNKGLAGGTIDPSIRGAVTQQAIAGLAADIALIADLRTKATVSAATGKVSLSAAQTEGLRDFARLQLGRDENDTTKLTAAEITAVVQSYYNTVSARILAVAGKRLTTVPRRLNDAQVTAYARLRLDILNTGFTALFGASKPFDASGAGAGGVPYVFDVRTDANLAQVSYLDRDGTTKQQSRYASLIGGATWQDQWLDVRIPGNALVPVSATRLTDAAPNIVGGTVDIVAQGNVGGFGNAVTIHYDGDSSKLTDTQKAVLASAGSGDISFVNNSDGSIDFTVARDRLLQIEASGAVSVDTQGRAFVGAKGDLAIGTVVAQAGASANDIRLVAGGSIVATRGDAGGYDIKGNALRIEAGNGAIGSISRPIRVDVAQVESARAARDVALDSLGSLRIGNVFAGGFLSLSGADITSMFDSTLVHIRADGGARFSAIDGIGEADRALQLASGNYDLNSRYGGVYVNAPTGSLAITGLNFAGDETAGMVGITAARDLGVTFDNPRPYYGITLGAGGTLTLGGSANLMMNDTGITTRAGDTIRIAGNVSLDYWTILGVGGVKPDLVIDGSLYMPFLDIANVDDVRVNGSLYGDYGVAIDTAGVFSSAAGATVTAQGPGHLNAAVVAFSDRSTLDVGGTTQGDPLAITSAGAVELGRITGGGWLQVFGADVDLLGRVANAGLDVVASGTVKVARVIATTDYLGLSGADLAIAGRGSLSAGRVVLRSDSDIDTSGYVVRGGAGGVSLTSAGALRLQSLTTPGVLTLRGATIDTSALDIGGMDAFTSGTLTANGRIVSSGLVKIRAADIALLRRIDGGSLDAAATGAIGVARDLRPTGALWLDAATLSITPGVTLAGSDVRLTSATALNVRGYTVTGTNSLLLGSDDALTVRALTQSGDVTLRGRDVTLLRDIDAGRLSAIATRTLAIADGIALNADVVTLGGANAIDATRFTIRDGWNGLTIRSAGDVTIGAATGRGNLTLAGDNVSMLGTVSAVGIDVTADGTLFVGHDLAALGALALRGGDLAITGGIWMRGGSLDLASDGAIDARGFQLDGGAGGITLTAHTDLTVGALGSTGDIALRGATLTTAGPIAGGAVTLSSPGALMIGGDITASGALAITGGAILSGATHLIGTGVTISGASLAAAGTAIDGQSGAISIDTHDGALGVGAIMAGDALELYGATITTAALTGSRVRLTGSGALAINGGVDATAGDVRIETGGAVTILGPSVVGQTVFVGGSTLDAGATRFVATGGTATLQFGGNATIGAIGAMSDATLKAHDLQINGDAAALGALRIEAAAISVMGPATLSGRGVSITGQSLAAGQSSIESAADVSIAAENGDVGVSSITAAGSVTINGGAIDVGTLHAEQDANVTGGAVTLGTGFANNRFDVLGGRITITDRLEGNSVSLTGGDTVFATRIDGRDISIAGRAVTLGTIGESMMGTVKVRAFEDFTLLDGATLRGSQVDIGARAILGGGASTMWASAIRLDAADRIDFAGLISAYYGDARAGGGPDRFAIGTLQGSVTVSYDATPLPPLLP